MDVGDRKILLPEQIAELLKTHYERLRGQRREVLNLLIGLSGGAAILSVTFLDDIAGAKKLLWLVIVAWLLLAFALFVAVWSLVLMNHFSLRYQSRLESLAQKAAGPIVIDDPQVWWELVQPHYSSRSALELPFAEATSAILFVLGVAFLALFSIVNVF